MDSPFLRIAHLSDLHFRRSLPGTSTVGRRRSREPILEAVLSRVMEQKVDLMVWTGDLLDIPIFVVDGSPKGFVMPEGELPWLKAAEEDYLYFRTQLEATGIPYRVLPGNHDHPGLMEKCFPQEPVLELGGFRVVSFIDHEHEAWVPRRLVPSRTLFEMLLDGADPSPQIHLQHYLLHPIAAGPRYTYAEHAFLRGRIDASGRVTLALSGHYHAGTPLERHGETWYGVARALCEAPHPWRLLEVSPGEVTVTEESLGTPPLAPVVFLDRDGVINDLASYTVGPEAMRLLPGAAAAIRRLNTAGMRAVVVTSQSAIGMGYVVDAVVQMVNERMQQLLADEGAFVDAIYLTRGAGSNSVLPEMRNERTEKSHIIRQALDELPLDREQAWVVGDRLTDLQAGADAGLGRGGTLVCTGLGSEEALRLGKDVRVAADLAEAVDFILGAQ